MARPLRVTKTPEKFEISSRDDLAVLVRARRTQSGLRIDDAAELSYEINRNEFNLLYSGEWIKLAFKIGDTFILDEIDKGHLSVMAEQMHVTPRFIGIHLRKLCLEVLKNLEVVLVGDLAQEEIAFMKKLNANIRTRVEKFLAEAAMLSST